MRMPQGAEWLILLLVVVLLFGAKRLPDAARGLGRSLRIFKAETKGLAEDDAAAAPAAPGTPASVASAAPAPAVEAPQTPPAPPVAAEQPAAAPVAPAPGGTNERAEG